MILKAKHFKNIKLKKMNIYVTFNAKIQIPSSNNTTC